jgi:type I restriction enzyme S subunit
LSSSVQSREAIRHLRLDASFFVGPGATIRRVNSLQSIPTKTLAEYADVVMLSGFTIGWIPARNPQKAKGMFAASAINEHAPEPSLYISDIIDPNVTLFEVRRGWIAITRSGTVGNVGLIYANLDREYLSNDAIRIIPKDHAYRGLLHAFLRSEHGRSLLQNLTYGSVVGHIKTFQVESLQVPAIQPSATERLNSITDAIIEARDSANELLSSAQQSLQSATRLPVLHATQSPQPPETGAADFMLVSMKQALNSNIDRAEYRLDAHFYNPKAQLAVAYIRQCREFKAVRAVAKQILMGPRFKRNYVESDQGVPFLSGKNIIQIRPTDLNYLSNLQMAEMQELLVKRGWTLITCSGTIGRTCLVWNNYEDYAASQHILRVIPDETQIDSGYLYAFLSSPYGYEQILRYRHGSVIDEVTDKQIEQVLIPLPSRKEQTAIGDKVREAYEKRAEAINLEDEAQAILMRELTKTTETIEV